MFDVFPINLFFSSQGVLLQSIKRASFPYQTLIPSGKMNGRIVSLLLLVVMAFVMGLEDGSMQNKKDLTEKQLLVQALTSNRGRVGSKQCTCGGFLGGNHCCGGRMRCGFGGLMCLVKKNRG